MSHTETKGCIDWRRFSNAGLEVKFLLLGLLQASPFLVGTRCALSKAVSIEFVCACQITHIATLDTTFLCYSALAQCSPTHADPLALRTALLTLHELTLLRRNRSEPRSSGLLLSELWRFLTDFFFWILAPERWDRNIWPVISRKLRTGTLNMPWSLCSTFSAVHYFQHPIIRRSLLAHNVCSVSVAWIRTGMISCAFIRVWDSQWRHSVSE